ncbi:hypothetical protein YC2023_043479 [Brassica napus]
MKQRPRQSRSSHLVILSHGEMKQRQSRYSHLALGSSRWFRRVISALIVDGSSFDGDGVLAANYGYFERHHEILWNGSIRDKGGPLDKKMAPRLDFSDWWPKDTRKGTPVVVKMENPNYSVVEIEGPDTAFRPVEKNRGKNTRNAL